MGVMHEEGRGMSSSDLGQAARYYDKACTAGLADGCKYRASVIAKMHEGCDAPSAEGCTNLGYLYENGIGVSANFSEAAGYYRRACAADRPVGCSNLGILHDLGRGVKQDYAEAAKLYQKACDLGGATGCNHLGRLFEKGHGAKKPDEKRALELYRSGCDKGSDRACASMKDLEERQAKKGKDAPPPPAKK
jgi:TPR repeat protein